jgi:hypothetical protein
MKKHKRHPGNYTGIQFNPEKVIENYLLPRICSPSRFYLLVHSRCRGFLFSLDHTQTHTTFGRTPQNERSARRRDLYLTTQTLYKRKTSMPPVGFEPAIPASARPQTHALNRAAAGMGHCRVNNL